MDHLSKLLKDAGEHGWLLDRNDGRRLEVSSSTFTRTVRKLGMAPRHRGIWGPEAGSFDYRSEIAAAARAVGAPCLVTGASALWMDGVLREEPTGVCLVVPLDRSPAARPGVCVHHTGHYDELRYRNVGQQQLAQTAHALSDYARHTDAVGMIRAIAESAPAAAVLAQPVPARARSTEALSGGGGVSNGHRQAHR